MKLNIKPLSVNAAWKGRRFRTPEYKRYCVDMLRLLRPYHITHGDLEIKIRFGLSSRGGDFDNPIKPFIDCLQKRYGFNDNKIKAALILVEHVKKNNEFVEFEIYPLGTNGWCYE